MIKTVLVLGASFHQLPLIRRLMQRSFRVITCDEYDTSPGHRLACRSIIGPLWDSNWLYSIISDLSVDCVLTMGSDFCFWAKSKADVKAGRLNSYDQALFLSKTSFRKLEGSLNSRRMYYSGDGSDVDKIVLEKLNNSIPLLIKPDMNVGGKGIILVDEPFANLDSLRDCLRQVSSISYNKKCLVESWVYSQYQICGDGIFHPQHGVLFFPGEGKFEEGRYTPYGEDFPQADSQLTQRIRLLLYSVISEATCGPMFFNSDILIGGEIGSDIEILEVAPRLGGNHLSTAIFESYGVDLLNLYIDYELGLIADEDFGDYFDFFEKKLSQPTNKVSIRFGSSTVLIKDSSVNYDFISCESVNAEKFCTISRVELKNEQKN